MKYMLLIYSDPTTWPDDPAEGQKIMNDYFSFTQEIVDSGEIGVWGVL